MVWNTAMTFGCAFIGGATGWITSKIARRHFTKNALTDALGFTASTFIHIAAVPWLAVKVPVMTFPFDKRFRICYSLHPFLAVGLCMLSFKVYDKKRQRMSVICLLMSCIFILSIVASVERAGPPRALIGATFACGMIGATMPLYPTF